MPDMFDSTNLAAVPNPAAVTDVLVYTDGIYANATEAARRFPHAILHTISAVGRVPARWIDVEPGCVWPPHTAVTLYLTWRAQGCRGFYDSTGTKPLLEHELANVGVSRSDVEWFEADPTGIRHVIAGDVATQWGWFAGYDQSTLTDPPPPPPPLTPSHGVPVTVRQALPAAALPIKDVNTSSSQPAQWDVVLLGANGHPYHIWYVQGEGWHGPEDLAAAS